MGLRIYERVRNEYGADEMNLDVKEVSNPFTNQGKESIQRASMEDDEDAAGGSILDDADGEGGGFLPEGYHYDEKAAGGGGGGSLPKGHAREDDNVMNEDGGFLASSVDEDNAHRQTSSFIPNSAESKQADSSDDNHMEVDRTPQSPPIKKRGRPSRVSIAGAPAPAEPSGEDIEHSPQQRPAKKRDRPSKISNGTPKSQVSKKAKGTPKSNKKRSDPTLSPPAANNVNGNSLSPEERVKTPARRSARKNTTAVKSKYFEGSSDSEEDSRDDEQEEKFQPKISRKGRRKTR